MRPLAKPCADGPAAGWRADPDVARRPVGVGVDLKLSARHFRLEINHPFRLSSQCLRGGQGYRLGVRRERGSHRAGCQGNELGDQLGAPRRGLIRSQWSGDDESILDARRNIGRQMCRDLREGRPKDRCNRRGRHRRRSRSQRCRGAAGESEGTGDDDAAQVGSKDSHGSITEEPSPTFCGCARACASLRLAQRIVPMIV